MMRVARARDLGPQFVRNPHRMVGQDGAYSIPLADETALWFFGDTLMGRRTPGESLWFPGGKPLPPGDMSGHHGIDKLQNNTGLILRDRTGRHGLNDFRYIVGEDGLPRQLVPHEPGEHPDEVRVWCLHGIELGQRLYLYYLTVRMLAEGPMPVNFELIGAGLSVGDRDTMQFRRVSHGGETIWWPYPQPQFGTTVLRGREDGYLYIYGVTRGNDGVQYCHVCRVPEERIEDLSSYMYYNGSEWIADRAGSKPVMTGMPNEMSVSWNAHLGCYLAVHSLDLSGQIVGRTSANPWGPWSEPTVLWRCEAPKIGYAIPYPPLIYAGKEHPELAEQGGRILYLTYIEFEEYFPHLVEVELE